MLYTPIVKYLWPQRNEIPLNVHMYDTMTKKAGKNWKTHRLSGFMQGNCWIQKIHMQCNVFKPRSNWVQQTMKCFCRVVFFSIEQLIWGQRVYKRVGIMCRWSRTLSFQAFTSIIEGRCTWSPILRGSVSRCTITHLCSTKLWEITICEALFSTINNTTKNVTKMDLLGILYR